MSPSNPHLFPTTRRTVLSRVRRQDPTGWEDFCQAYTGPALRLLSHLGLSKEDAQDTWQEILYRAQSDTLWGYDADRGRFRPFLVRCLRNLCRDQQRRHGAQKRGAHLTESADAPREPGDRHGPSRWEELAAEELDHARQRRRAIAHALFELLGGYPDAAEREMYEAWLSGHTDKEIAASRKLTPAQVAYVRQKLDDYLAKRWSNEL